MMPDISDCYHGRIEASLAEQRLRRFGKDRGYLDRVSNVQPGFFILSVFVKGEVIHRVFYSSSQEDPSRDIQMWLVF